MPHLTADLPVAEPPSLVRLSLIELRKAVDTRSSQVLLLVVIGLGLAALGYEVYSAGTGPVGVEDFLGSAMQAVLLVLPVIGVLATTAEWSQRTALSTFTLAPRRGQVLAAKVLSGLALGVVAVLVVLAATVLAMLVAGVMTGSAPSWEGLVRLVGGALFVTLLQLLMASSFGALIPMTAAAVTVFLVAPTLWTNAGVAVLGDAAGWVDVFAAFGRMSRLDATDLPQTLTSFAVWIVVPLVLGIRNSLHRDVT